MPKTGPEKKSVRSRQNSRSTSVTTKSVPELTGSIKIKEENQMKKMKKVLAMLCGVLSVLSLAAAFAGEDNNNNNNNNNVSWQNIVGNITVSPNYAVGGSDPG